ncbi:MAG: hypothetical protein Q4G14_13590 [Paracoccus sp. (in: a-proteobacteria)]|uniref:hypothetical protein n=1 Tax=Paracoccus sp. TaxID=267 RepID=UPI0026DED7F0|nr:hypothetical protein [Paracoccus sp. (in: a-proteobacteria)]MDO5614258.1 hypothetical protein [Paracoccus sp. (in: a-proteobacteria)]
MTAPFTARIAATAAVLTTALTLASPAAAAPIKAWSAMAGVEPAVLLHTAQELPLSAAAVDDQPYCAPNAEIAMTLRQDFAEQRIDTAGVQGHDTELWGSDLMGTWTLVAARDDDTSCIIASGIGFDTDTDSTAFYRTAGLI